MPTRPLRIFHVEAPSPLDVLEARAEGPALHAIASLIGHKIHRQTVLSEAEFATAVEFLGEIGRFEDNQKSRPIVLHVSAHGYRKGHGLAFGCNEVPWLQLAKHLQPFSRIGAHYKGARIVVLSACYAHKQKMTTAMMRNARGKEDDDEIVLPRYLFCTEDEVQWQEAAVGWTLFYYLMPQTNLDKPESVQKMLTRIASLGIRIYYFRLDHRDNAYKRFKPERV